MPTSTCFAPAAWVMLPTRGCLVHQRPAAALYRLPGAAVRGGGRGEARLGARHRGGADLVEQVGGIAPHVLDLAEVLANRREVRIDPDVDARHQ
ncbi:MAG: hypothetical protein M5U09_18935 [Gammaproteobacteria bacterium]|nr:hypothetical protein [Gammaproteobacteria bacterium]